MVLRRRQNTDGMHKLSSPWEGPYIVKAVTWLGSYRLCDQDGTDIPNSWHIEHLRHFYPWDVLQKICTFSYIYCISIMILSMMFSPFAFHNFFRNTYFSMLNIFEKTHSIVNRFNDQPRSHLCYPELALLKGPCLVLVTEWQPRWTICVYVRYTGN